MNKNIGKKILIVLAIILIIIVGGLTYIDWSLKPLPEEKRNISSSNIKMIVDMEDTDYRTPIIRTYTKEEFDSFDQDELDKIKDLVNGNIEGDIPALKIEDGRGILEISFQMIDNNKDYQVVGEIVPDDIPKIKIGVTNYDSQQSKRTIENSFIESEEEGIYLYEIKRYFDDEELENFDKEEFFMEFMYIEVDFEINKEKYVSIFAIHTVEDK